MEQIMQVLKECKYEAFSFIAIINFNLRSFFLPRFDMLGTFSLFNAIGKNIGFVDKFCIFWAQ